MLPYQYVISLRIWHPTMPHEDISAAVGRTPGQCWSVGDPRMSAKGKPLGGFRDSTYWRGQLTERTGFNDLFSVEQALASQADALAPLATFFSTLRAEGGGAELFVGLFSSENMMLDLGLDLMTQLLKNSLTICLDYYPHERIESGIR